MAHAPRSLRAKIETSKAMKRVAEERRCPACGRGAAMSREHVDYDARLFWRQCRYCNHLVEVSY